MMAFPSMLAKPARDAGMKTPVFEGEDDDFDSDKFPHFAVFCNIQLGRPMQWGEQFENAKIIAAIPNEKIRSIGFVELLAMGLRWSN